jgi:tetratricopeptide (TPR) repeat protein
MSASAREQYRAGLGAAQQGNLPAARAGFESALSSDSRAYQAAYNAGVIAERQGQESQADGFYQRALSIQPDYELALIARARLLVRSRRVNEAVTMAADVARRFPGNFAVRAEYARLLVVAQRYPDAIREGREILRADERNVGAKLAIAEAYRAQGRLDLALYIVDEVIHGSSSPGQADSGPGLNDPRAHYLRGLLRVEVSRDTPGAIQSFTRAVELDPQFAEARNNLGVYLLQTGNNRMAIEHLRAAVALSPSWAKAHLNLGDALRAGREYDPALAELQRAQQLDPTLHEVHYNYGRLYGEQARAVPSSGVENLNRRLQMFQQSQASFTRYRDVLGPQYPTDARHDDVEQQLARLLTLIERTTRARDRAMRQQNRGGTRPSGGSGGTGGTGGTGGSGSGGTGGSGSGNSGGASGGTAPSGGGTSGGAGGGATPPSGGH